LVKVMEGFRVMELGMEWDRIAELKESGAIA
jgi:hypothetical protein